MAWGIPDKLPPPPLRIPPIYDILTGNKGGQSRVYSIHKKFLEKFLGKIGNYFPHIGGWYIYYQIVIYE